MAERFEERYFLHPSAKNLGRSLFGSLTGRTSGSSSLNVYVDNDNPVYSVTESADNYEIFEVLGGGNVKVDDKENLIIYSEDLDSFNSVKDGILRHCNENGLPLFLFPDDSQNL